MRGKRVSSHKWNPAACSAKTRFDNIVLIDVDSDTCESVVVLDVPESVKQRFRGSRIIPFHDVISIDDDDEDADLPRPRGVACGSDGLDGDSIPTRRNSLDSDADVDDCCVVPDRWSTSESSEFDNHQSSEHNIGRRFGLGPDLEEDTSGNDLSDCEVMGDSSNDIRRQWEEAFLKRKYDCSDGQFGLGDSVLHENQGTSADELPKKSAEQMKEEEAVNEAAFIAQSCGEKNSSDCQDTSTAPAIHDDVINGREKLKESSDFKRTNEEELASRQLQIRLQAEEAQRLRRKKRAETLRKQDMERRQKQRVDEIRETQKKDVETMNIREQLRAQVRRELSLLELTCFDMVSLLRRLGMNVPGQPPLSKEVHAAYKKALLKFHPDRTSTKDIHQQVEAEEKFKLISRMKEKFPFS